METEIKKKAIITEDSIKAAYETLQKYKNGKKSLEEKIIQNEQWWKGRHWENIRGEDDLKPVSGWLFNALANKHADAMDNYPYPNVLPREESDIETAETLSSVLPVLLEYNNFAQVYSDVWWYKLKQGTGVYSVMWDNSLYNGLGDVAIRKVDLLNLFWEPGILNIQDSPNLFHVELHDKKEMEISYPKISFSTDDDSTIKKYVHDDSIDASGKVMVIDWYYKKDGKVHFCKFANNNILYSSEDEGTPIYDHGFYPFVFDVLYPEEDTPVGFGYIDITKDAQMYIDKLQSAILKNALVSSKKRIIVRADGGINESDLMDVNKEVIRSDTSLGDDSYRELTYTPLPAIYESILRDKIEELKETSGNRDFSQGATTNGVTAASAIAALQEAGSKLSRDMIDASYRAFTNICYQVIELIRQFYTESRTFRITNDKGMSFVSMDNSQIMPQSQGDDFGEDRGERKPIFDIKVAPERDSAYSRLSNNELAIQFFQLGFFNPQLSDQASACLKMMKFEGKDEIVKRINENSQMQQQLMAMQQQLIDTAQVVDAQNGTALAPSAAMMDMSQPMPGRNDIGKKESFSERAANIASSQAAPR